DVGCGMGQLSRAIARAAGKRGRVVGIERSREQIEEGRRQAAAAKEADTVDVREGDAGTPPLSDDEWGTFDIAHARFVLEHVADPARVVRAMVKAVRPGGRIVLEDDDHELLRFHPAVPEFESAWRAYMRAYQAVGNDPVIGRKLPALLVEAGARPSASDWLFFGACQGSPTFPIIVSNCRSIMAGARASVIGYGGLSADAFEAALVAFDRWSREPGAALWYCTFWAEGVRPNA
ncbi:MAG TPA: methyltransferase domain-containing protein, partial [Candidatus Krumholzibacteria bacterium]|nr:methyltransferase domain-containing protein [Candidatus Krumholzibacteria bacterium]